MGIRAEDHLAALCQHLAGVLMDDCLMRRNINAAVFLGAGKTKHVVILVDRSTDSTETVVAVRQNVRDRELLQPRCTSGLNNSNKCNIM